MLHSKKVFRFMLYMELATVHYFMAVRLLFMSCRRCCRAFLSSISISVKTFRDSSFGSWGTPNCTVSSVAILDEVLREIGVRLYRIRVLEMSTEYLRKSNGRVKHLVINNRCTLEQACLQPADLNQAGFKHGQANCLRTLLRRWLVH
jgi:hypothetical protein